MYSASRRILESEDLALHLFSREFYNTIRKLRLNGENNSVFSLIAKLQEH